MNFSFVLLLFAAFTNANCTRVLKVATIESPPFIIRGDNNITTEGFLIDILNRLKDDLHFDYQLYFVDRFGRKDANGTWDGLIGEIVAKRADFALAPLAVNAAREEVVDFTVAFMQTGLGVMYKKPKMFNSLANLVLNSSIPYGVIRNGNTFRFLKNNRFQLFKTMGDELEMNPDRFVSNGTEAVSRVRNEQFAFVGESRMINYYTKRPPCDLDSISYPLETISYAVAFTPAHDMIANFNMKILQMAEDGTLHLLEAKWWPNLCA